MFGKVEKLWVQNPFIIEGFQNILCMPFNKCSMTNVRKTLQMNTILSKNITLALLSKKKSNS